ncbi:hypothetical protein ACEE94_10620 [Staphylococcus epidermidis]
MKLIDKVKHLWQSYKNKYIEPPIKEKYVELKKNDYELYKHRVDEEVSKVIIKQYITPAIIISLFSIYSIYYYFNQLIVYLGGV